MNSNDIDWNDVIKKEARGVNDADFGEIQSVDSEYVITQKGLIDKEIFSFPVNLVQDYDGNRVLFKVPEEEARNSYMQSQNADLNSERETETTTTTTTTTNDNKESLSNTNLEEEEVIPLMSEEVDVRE